MTKAILIAVICLVGATGVSADDEIKFTPTAQVRYRFEHEAKDFDANSPPRNFSLLRSRLGVKFTPDEDMDLVLMLQDARIMGEETHTLLDGNADNFDLREGYMKLRKLFWDPIDLKLGRMRVNYGEQRLIGAVEWTNISRSFDGGILTVHDSWISTDLFVFAQVESLLIGDDGDLHVVGFNVGLFERSGARKNQVYLIGQVRDPLQSLNRWTGGYYVSGKIGNLEYTSNGAYQWGEITLPTDTMRTKQDVKAYMLTADLWYRMPNIAGRPGVSAGVDYLSGDSDVNAEDNSMTDTKYKVFDTLYATNHKFYGFMDYFLNIPLNTFGRGLIDAYARAQVQLGKVPLRLDFHVFESAQDYKLTSGGTSTSFGTEIDVTFKYDYNDFLTVLGGASMFDPGDIFKDRPRLGADRSKWAYLMLIASI